MRRLRYLLLIALLVLLPANVHAAIELYSLDYDVYLNPSGDADVKIRWHSYQDDTGTENYIPISNLGGSEITNFKVSEEGMTYRENTDWDIDRSREEKTGEYGLIPKSDGVELAWGLGEPGEHEYLVEYTITEIVKNLDDAQMLFWQFVNHDLSNPPGEVSLFIHADEPITPEDARIWAFGYTGRIEFEDGGIRATTSAPMRC